jgi:hypothetical protein
VLYEAASRSFVSPSSRRIAAAAIAAGAEARRSQEVSRLSAADSFLRAGPRPFAHLQPRCRPRERNLASHSERRLGLLPAGRGLLNADPTIQFSNNSSDPVTALGVTAVAASTLTGPAMTDLRTWSGSGVSSHTNITAGIFWRF